MRKINRIVHKNIALRFLRGCSVPQFVDRVTKLVSDCLDQINEFYDVLSTVEDGKDGKDGEQGPAGPAGPVGPVGPKGNNGIGVPPGGKVGQYLKKKSNSDYDTEWSDIQGSGDVTSVNGKTGDVVLSAEDVDALPSDTQLFSGDYNDLTNKPTIPAEQVQSDWNQTNNSSKDFIKNKPTIPTVPTNVSAFNNDAGYLTQHQDISGKADKSEMSVTDGTGADADKTTITLKSGTSATVLKSHQDISGKQDTLVSGTNIKTINNESILGSGNISAEKPVVIEAPVNATDATLPITTLVTEVGKYYRIDVAVDTLAVTLPAMTDLTTVRTVVIYFTAGTTPAITISSTAPSGGSAPDVYYQDGFEIEAGSTYEINALFNGAAWIVASVQINVE